MIKNSKFVSKRMSVATVALASLLSGVLYFVYVAPVHSEFALRHPFGNAYFYLYLGFVLVFMAAGVGSGIATMLYGFAVPAPADENAERNDVRVWYKA